MGFWVVLDVLVGLVCLYYCCGVDVVGCFGLRDCWCLMVGLFRLTGVFKIFGYVNSRYFGLFVGV